MSFVLDASVALSWCFRDETNDVASFALDRLEHTEAYVPAIWSLEVANGLLTAERRKRMTAPSAADALDILLSLPIVPDPAERSRDLASTWRLARSHGLTAYDSAYLELAIRFRMPLVSLDDRLVAAAQKEGLPVLEAI